jgi:hypothetical protein
MLYLHNSPGASLKASLKLKDKAKLNEKRCIKMFPSPKSVQKHKHDS